MNARFADLLPDLGKPLPTDVQRYSISGGYKGTRQTIEAMRKCVDWGKRWPGTRRIVSALIASCARKDYMCMVQAIFKHVQGFHYAYDPSGVECVQGIDETESIKMGDCDDFTVYLCSALESIGIPCYFKTIKAKKGSNEFTHVYAVANVPGIGQVPLDATMSHPAGWEAPGDLPCKLWPSSSDDMEIHGGGANSSMNGLPITGVSGLPIMTLQAEDNSVSMSGLACGCNKTTPDDNDQTASTMSGLSVISDCDIDTGETMSGLACSCDGNNDPVSEGGMSGLGDDSANQATIYSVISGDAYATLREAKDDSNQRMIDVGQLAAQAQQIQDPQQREAAIQLAQQAQAAAVDERQTLYQAINAYSNLANEIQADSGGVFHPQQLSGLGVAPLVILGYTIAITATLYALSQIFATVMNAWQGKADTAKGLVSQLSDLVNAASGAATSASQALKNFSDALVNPIKTVGDFPYATIAVVGGLGLLTLLLLRKRKGA